MFVSFVVATYNCADRVPILNQTIASLAGMDCEFCIADGGSKDDTLEALSDAPNVHVVCSEPDKGIYDAWNRALDHCQGEYLAFIGVDDRPQREFLEVARRQCNSVDNSPAVIYGNRILVRGDLQRSITYPDKPRLFDSERPVFDIPHQAALNHRSLFAIRRFDPGFHLAGDLDFYLGVREAIRERGYLHIPQMQVIAAEEGVSRSSASFGIYRREFAGIEASHNLKLGFSTWKLRLLQAFESFPWLFERLKDLSWALRHDTP